MYDVVQLCYTWKTFYCGSDDASFLRPSKVHPTVCLTVRLDVCPTYAKCDICPTCHKLQNLHQIPLVNFEGGIKLAGGTTTSIIETSDEVKLLKPGSV
jgi:hypothetical protein